jgi:mannosyltransferase
MLIPARTGGASVPRTGPVPLATSIPAEVWLLAAITAVAALLRFAMLGSQSYWVDEAQAANELRMSFGSMLHTIAHGEPNPPLFFVVGWLWAKVFGTSEAGLRSLSAIAGTAVVPIAHLCGRELVSKRAGLVAAALVAVSPFMIWYSQEAREYMLLAAFCGASLLFFARCLRTAGRRELLWWTAFSAFALLTNYFAAFLVAPEAIWLLWRLRDRAAWVSVAVLAAVQIALLPHFLDHASHPRDWIGAFPLAIRIKQVPVAFAAGSLYQSGALRYGLIGAALLAAAVIVLVVVGAGPRQLRGAGVAVLLAAFVLLVPLVLAVAGRDYYIARALIPAWLPLAVLTGAACTVPVTRSKPLAYAGGALLTALLALFIYAQVRIDTHSAYQRPDWRGVAAALGPSAPGPRAIVAYDGRFAEAPLLFYLRGSAPSMSGSPALDELDIVGNAYQIPSSRPGRGMRLISNTAVRGYRVVRFTLPTGSRMSAQQAASTAAELLKPAAVAPVVLVQRRSA